MDDWMDGEQRVARRGRKVIDDAKRRWSRGARGEGTRQAERELPREAEVEITEET